MSAYPCTLFIYYVFHVVYTVSKCSSYQLPARWHTCESWSLTLWNCALILSLVMAYLEPSILKSERICYQTMLRKRKEKRKNRDTEDQFSQTDTYWSSGLFCCRCLSLPFWLIKFSLILILWSASAVRYLMHIQHSLNQTPEVTVGCAAASKQEDWVSKRAARWAKLIPHLQS